jgi:hypothetical protein
VRGRRASTDGVGHVHHLVVILEGLDACKRQANFGVESADDQSLLPGGLHGFTEGRILEGVHRGPVDRLDAVELGQDRCERGAVEAVLDTDRREDYWHAERLGGLGQKPDIADDLERLLLVVDQHQALSSAVQTPKSFVMVALLVLVVLVWVRGAISAMRLA